jgi:hypothetical protein
VNVFTTGPGTGDESIHEVGGFEAKIHPRGDRLHEENPAPPYLPINRIS